MLLVLREANVRPEIIYAYQKTGRLVTEENAQGYIPGAGDDTHEKLRLPPGETVLYVQDATGAVYRARFVVPEGDAKEITAFIAPPA